MQHVNARGEIVKKQLANVEIYFLLGHKTAGAKVHKIDAVKGKIYTFSMETNAGEWMMMCFGFR